MIPIPQTWYTINQSPVDIQGVNVSYDSPQAVNVPIKLEAQASGGITKLYKFNVYDGKTWTDLTSFVTNPSYTWTPSKPGHYKFSVHVKDSRSKASYDDFHVFYYDVVDGVKITGVTYPSEPQAVNQPVVVNATTSGGTKALYEYWVLENGVWKIAQAYSLESKLTWTPAKAGEYKFSLHVKDQLPSKEYDTYQAFHIRAQ